MLSDVEESKNVINQWGLVFALIPVSYHVETPSHTRPFW